MKVITKKKGPKNDKRVVLTLGESFFFFLLTYYYFIAYLGSNLHDTRLEKRWKLTMRKTGQNDARRIV